MPVFILRNEDHLFETMEHLAFTEIVKKNADNITKQILFNELLAIGLLGYTSNFEWVIEMVSVLI